MDRKVVSENETILGRNDAMTQTGDRQRIAGQAGESFDGDSAVRRLPSHDDEITDTQRPNRRLRLTEDKIAGDKGGLHAAAIDSDDHDASGQEASRELKSTMRPRRAQAAHDLAHGGRIPA